MARTARPPVHVPGVADPVAPVSESLATVRDKRRADEADSRERLAADRDAAATAAASVSDRTRAVAEAAAAREAEGAREVARMLERAAAARARAAAGEATDADRELLDAEEPAGGFDVDAATGAELDAYAAEHGVEGYRKSDRVDERRSAVAAHLAGS